MKIKLLFAFFIAILAIMAMSPSCKKTGPAEALIIVKKGGTRVQGASVSLKQDSVINNQTGVQANINQTKETDHNGEAFFEFKLEAVLNVEVTYDTLFAKDYIKLEQSEQVTKEIVLQ